MYVVPNTQLEFFHDIHVDPDYENTIYFPTTQAKDNYFSNLPSIKVPNCTYQRERRGYCRVEVPIGQLLTRSYMRFKNSNFEDKWFYAFILDVEYINNITTEVHYQLDIMMTWCGGAYTLDQCFVEREHTSTDEIGDNIVPETLAISNRIENSHFRTGTGSQTAPQGSGTMGSSTLNWRYIVVMTPTDSDLPEGDGMGLYSGLHYEFFDSAVQVSNYITGLGGIGQERIQGIFYIPKYFEPVSGEPVPRRLNIEIRKPLVGQCTLDGYTPKNNKLYTYPYNYIEVDNMEGDKGEFAFELFRSTDATFSIMGIVGEQTQLTCTPLYYKVDTTTPAWQPVRNQLGMKEFPMCAWTVDTFKAYLSQQLVSISAQVTGGAVSAIATGGLSLVGSAVGVTHNVLQSATGLMMRAQRPHDARGTNLPLLSCAGPIPYKDFRFSRLSVRHDEAKRIDDYFTMFGYAVNEVKVPNVNARPYYTYVKTIGCHINGDIPAGDAREIESIFDKGVRFWKEDHTHIGDYSVNNAPVSTP